jgi:hypothetical protein
MMSFIINKKIIDKFYGPVLVMIVLLLLSTLSSPSAWAETGRSLQSVNPEAYRLAIKKTGFYYGVANGLVSLMDRKSHKTTSYFSGPEMIFTRYPEALDVKAKRDPDNLVEIKPESLPMHSIVQLIIINAEVVEIILIAEPS